MLGRFSTVGWTTVESNVLSRWLDKSNIGNWFFRVVNHETYNGLEMF